MFPSRFALLAIVGTVVSSGMFATPAQGEEANPRRLRIIVETDAGGDPDDEQSLVRFLVYANEWDVEGIICNRPHAVDGENKNPQRTGLGVVKRITEAYGECHANLVKHDPRYPSPDLLLKRVVSGNEDRDDGVALIMAAVDSTDPRPVWFCNWGTIKGSDPSSLKRALDRVLKERGEKGYAKFKERILLSSDDQFGEHTTREPAFRLWVDTFRPEVDRKRWYHRFSALTATAGGFDLQRDVLTGHGPLGALYPTNTTHVQKEGDTMTFLYLVPTGMNDPLQPTWGSWAGRYGLNPTYPEKPYYWANQSDQWNGTTHRENTLKRWAVDLQNDFRARMDWCVKSFDQANHPPTAILNGDEGGEILKATAGPGPFQLSAAGSRDRDNQKLSYEWTVYPEASSFTGPITIAEPDSEEAQVVIPADATGKMVHVILTVRDNGEPALARYRRIVITCK